MAIPSCKLVTVGDGAVGKTALLSAFTSNKITPEYVPTVFDTINAMTTMGDGKPVSCVLYDSAGQEEYDNLRVLSYPQTDCFLLCYSVVQPSSFMNITSRWVPELRRSLAEVPILLIGTKIDLRKDSRTLEQLSHMAQKPIEPHEGQKLAEDIGAYGYVECSAVTQENIALVFQEAIDAWLQYQAVRKQRDMKHKGCCAIL